MPKPPDTVLDGLGKQAPLLPQDHDLVGGDQVHLPGVAAVVDDPEERGSEVEDEEDEEAVPAVDGVGLKQMKSAN